MNKVDSIQNLSRKDFIGLTKTNIFPFKWSIKFPQYKFMKKIVLLLIYKKRGNFLEIFYSFFLQIKRKKSVLIILFFFPESKLL